MNDPNLRSTADGSNLVQINRYVGKFENKRILIIGHVTEIYGPVQALVGYSKKNVGKLFFVLHPLPSAAISNSEFNAFEKGVLVKSKKLKNYNTPEPFSYIQHLFFSFLFLRNNKEHYDLCIGIDNLNAFFGLLLRRMGVVDKVAFYVIDYTPKRFENPVLNFFYHSMDRFCCKYCDSIWNLSERMVKLRYSQGVSTKKNLIVPIGIELEKIQNSSTKKTNRNVLVFVSHLTKSKGIELVLNAMTEITQKVPNARLEIIGSGPHEYDLRKLVEKLNLTNCVKFVGLMQHDDLMKYLPSVDVALATYVDDVNSITYFADPTKPKEYLACGLPVIITRVPWIANEIEQKTMGIAINYNRTELVAAVLKLLTDDAFYEECSKNAKIFSSSLSWEKIFYEAFGKSFEI